MHRNSCAALFVFVCLIALMSSGNTPARAADPGDEFWVPGYHHAGVQGTIRTMISQPGALIVGGGITAVGDVAVKNIARLQTSAPPAVTVTGGTPMGDGFDGTVHGLCEYNGDIIAAGSFVNSGDLPVEHVARWDGAAWHAIGEGLPGSYPKAAVAFQGDLYVDRYRWNGSSWEDIFQPYGGITSLVVHDGLLYVGGSFTEIQGQPVSFLFAWDGTQVLSLGEGFPVPVLSMAATATALYATGEGEGDGFWFSRVASWDGAAWTTEFGNYVTNLATYGGDVYASTIVLMPGRNHQYVLKSNASGTWQTVADFCPGVMMEHDGVLMLQAHPGADPTILTPGIAAFNGVAVQEVFLPRQGFSTGFEVTASYGSGLLVGGGFTIADGQPIAGSAMTASGAWFQWGNPADVATPFPASLTSLATVGTEAFGIFHWVDWDIGVEELAKLVWDVDRFRWDIIETGSMWVGHLQTVGSQLFNIGSGGLNLVDLQDGSLTNVAALSLNGGIYDTCEYLGSVAVCGSFSTVNDVPSSNVIRYTDGAWESLGDPLPGYRVETIAPMDNGQLAAAAWVDGVYRVSIYDGVNWSTLPGDFKTVVDNLVFHRRRLFAAGSFNQVGPVWAAGVAVWTGDQWAPVGSGLKGGSFRRVTDVTSLGESLYFVGSFVQAGGQPSVGFAEWTGDPALFTGAPSSVPDSTPHANRLLGAAHPNPFNPRTEISFVVPGTDRIQLGIGIYDMRGKRVRELVDQEFEPGSYTHIWNGLDEFGRTVPSGVYFARLTTAAHTEAVKLTLVR